MSPSPDSFNDIARAIQLALAPVFLLSGIAGLLSVMTGRLARIIDRGRELTEGLRAPVSAELDPHYLERSTLEQRRHLTSVAITSSTIAALLVCVVIATIFLEVMLGVPVRWLIGALFTAAMVALVIGLAYFLREVHLAMESVRIPTTVPSKGRAAANE
jgi:hypothetical protein